jgi:hypothetical protein
MVPIPLWVLSAYILKKMDDKRRTYMSEEEYRRLQLLEDEARGSFQRMITDERHKQVNGCSEGPKA